MSLMKILQQAQNGQGLGQLASQFGLEQGQIDDLAKMITPAIGSAAKQKAQTGGLQDLLGSLKGEAQGGLFDDVAQATSAQGQAQGMDFLKTLMGGAQAPQEMAREAANQSGIDASKVMQLLPALAAMLQGGMQKNLPDASLDSVLQNVSGDAQASNGGIGGLIGSLLGGGQSASAQSEAPELGALGALLDADGDGSPLNDILGKFLK